jgi:hypothetical protein
MAFQVSPGINISEIDLTAGVQTVSLSSGAAVGTFQWGPALDVTTISSESDLVTVFGKPDNTNYADWFSASSFLAYSNSLRVVRALSTGAYVATADPKTLTGTVTTTTTALAGSGTVFQTQLQVGQVLFLGAGAYATVASISNNTVATIATALTNEVTTAALAAFGANSYFNETQYDDLYDSNTLPTGTGVVSARWAGELGNSLKISVCPSATAFEDTVVAGTITVTGGSNTVSGTTASSFSNDLVVGDQLYATVSGAVTFIGQVSALSGTNTIYLVSAATTAAAGTFATTTWRRRWEYASNFDKNSLGTSAYVSATTGSTDELHVAVIDANGKFTGVVGQVLETYAYASKASDSKDAAGNSNYYVTLLNQKSQYVWWLAHPTTSNTNWGSAATGATALTYGAGVLPYTRTFYGGTSDNANITTGRRQVAWDLFADPDSIDVSLLISGPFSPSSTLGAYILNNIAEVRKDVVVFFSPDKDSVVNNIGSEVTDIVTDRASVNSSYGVMDANWKYAYDKYNDEYRWVPLNGDVAGLAARTDTTNDPWYSPAGFSRGNIKNVVKLAWNPKQADRDDLYRLGINPIVSFPAQGVILYGDKTLLSRPSAFDRINVRRLFIALEKTISRLAKAQLFEFNDEFTRASFRSAVEPFLADVRARRGVTDYLVVCDGTNNTPEVVDSYQFRGDIYIKPTRSINFIQLNFVAVRSGVSFQEVVGVA